MSQSSSTPLQVSAGGSHGPQAQPAVHVCVPDVPQLALHVRLAPGAQVKVSSIEPSQSSSAPLHISVGGAQLPQLHVPSQVRVPVEPQLVVQASVLPVAQVKISSTKPSQSSSAPLHTSVGGRQASHVQLPPQVRVPLEPQLVRQPPVAPITQTKVSSGRPSQSSSAPLQVSVGGEHVPHAQLASQIRDPVDPQEVAQEPLLP